MATYQAHELQTISSPARPATASNGHTQSTIASTAIVNYHGLYTSPRSRFHPGLSSRPRPEPKASFLHKLNSAYTAIGLAVTLALTFITYRLNVLTWELSRWTAKKDYLELCIELKQANLALTKGCKTALADGLAPSPSFISRRWLDELHHSSWVNSLISSVYNAAIREQKDAGVWYDGITIKHELDAEPLASFMITAQPDLEGICVRLVQFFVSTTSIILVFWMAYSAKSYIILYLHLHQRRKKSSSNIQTEVFNDLQGGNLFRILPAVLTVGSVLSQWSMRSWTQARLLLDGSEKLNAAMADAKHETGTRPQARKRHRAGALKKKKSRQKRKNRGGRKEKAD